MKMNPLNLFPWFAWQIVKWPVTIVLAVMSIVTVNMTNGLVLVDGWLGRALGAYEDEK
jgi:hypothetical protein